MKKASITEAKNNLSALDSKRVAHNELSTHRLRASRCVAGGIASASAGIIGESMAYINGRSLGVGRLNTLRMWTFPSGPSVPCVRRAGTRLRWRLECQRNARLAARAIEATWSTRSARLATRSALADP